MVTRTLTDAKIDARTFSHAQARAKQCIKNWSASFCDTVMHFIQVLRIETSSSDKQNNVREKISVQGHYTFHRRRNE